MESPFSPLPNCLCCSKHETAAKGKSLILYYGNSSSISGCLEIACLAAVDQDMGLTEHKKIAGSLLEYNERVVPVSFFQSSSDFFFFRMIPQRVLNLECILSAEGSSSLPPSSCILTPIHTPAHIVCILALCPEEIHVNEH